MRLVHEQPVHTQLLKGHYIVLLLIVQAFELGFQVLAGLFHLLDGEVFRFFPFGLVNGLQNLIQLILDGGLLPLRG